ncbi:hypothetical protein F0L74_27150 [Chitinophaga agrisoli]|uniref:Uncharacterized protein n=1 Tax=Chitinophaga agrisoli TaxID=2607653 RepID=A0A5B2VN68_9BACT|nr:hypothetical protein [Chitinophaga agrisoli]KAA2239866.1 hypothetical protein F0L74_27150 [Chitinophaga agrisoli]
MITIYLDKQLLSYLRNKDSQPANDEHQRQLHLAHKLSTFLEKNKDSLLLFYSHAHILDLQNDKSEKKYEDLVFMDKLIGRNYLTKSDQDETSYRNILPSEAFRQHQGHYSLMSSIASLDNLFDLEGIRDFISPDQLSQLQKQLDILKLPGFPLLGQALNNIPEEHKAVFSQMFPTDEHTSFFDVISTFSKYMDDFQNSPVVYKGLRKVVNDGISAAKFVINLDDYNIPDPSKKQLIGKNLLEFVKNVLEQIGNQNPSQFDLHYQAYFHLDLLGIEPEKSKKLKTSNLLADAQHSFYGAHCDYIVSEDLKFREKSKMINAIFGVETKVLSVEEFMADLFWLNVEKQVNESDFWSSILYDLKNGLVMHTHTSSIDGTVVTIKPFINYFNYFNRIQQVITPQKRYWCLYHSLKSYSHWTAYATIEKITNIAFNVFGFDIYGKGKFDWEKDKNVMKVDDCAIRTWIRENLQILLVLQEIDLQLFVEEID